MCLWATLPAWKIKLAIGYTSDGKEFIQEGKKGNQTKWNPHVVNQLLYTPFLCCYVFCDVGGRYRSESEPMTKAFRPSSNDFSPFLCHLFSSAGQTHTKLPRQQFLCYNPTNNNGRPKMRIKTLVPHVLCLLFGAAASRQGWSHHQQQQQQQPHKRWTMVNRWEEGELHNRSALFRCELLHIFTGGKKMINDRGALCVGRRCRSGEWMKGLLPPCLLLCYVYNYYNNDTRRWNQKKKKEEKLGISYLKIYSRIDLYTSAGFATVVTIVSIYNRIGAPSGDRT